MDTAFIDHLLLDPETAFEEVRKMREILMKTGGEMIGIWHNYALGETGPYKGWQEFYSKTIKLMEGS
jgi:hypothetical protein